MTLRLLLVLSFLLVPSLARLGGNSREVVRNGYRLLSETQKPVADGDNSKSGGKQPTPANNPTSKPDQHDVPEKEIEKDDKGTTHPPALKQKHFELTFSRELKPKNDIESDKVKKAFRNTVKRVFEEMKIATLKGSPVCKITGKTADCEFPYFPGQLTSRHNEVLNAIKQSVEGELKKEGIEVLKASWHNKHEKHEKHEKGKTQQHGKKPSEHRNPSQRHNPSEKKKKPQSQGKHHMKFTFSKDLTEADQETLNNLFKHVLVAENIEITGTCTFSGETADCEFPTASKHHQKIVEAIKNKMNKKDLKPENYQWDSGSQHSWDHHSKSHRNNGKIKEEPADSASPYSSSTLTALAAVICILLLGLLSVFMYRFLCKKDLVSIASETPKSKKKRKKTKTMGKKKFAKLENNFSSSSDDEKN